MWYRPARILPRERKRERENAMVNQLSITADENGLITGSGLCALSVSVSGESGASVFAFDTVSPRFDRVGSTKIRFASSFAPRAR